MTDQQPQPRQTSESTTTSFVGSALRENPLLVFAALIAAVAIVWGSTDIGALFAGSDEAPTSAATNDGTAVVVQPSEDTGPVDDTEQVPTVEPPAPSPEPDAAGTPRTVDGEKIVDYPYPGVATKGNVDGSLLAEAALDAGPVATAAVTAYRAPSFRDATPDAWLDRVTPYVTSGYDKALRSERVGADAEFAWRQFTAEQRDYRVRIVGATLTDFFPHHGSSLTIAVEYVVSISAAGGPWSADEAITVDFVDMEMTRNGDWLVSDIRDSSDRT